MAESTVQVNLTEGQVTSQKKFFSRQLRSSVKKAGSAKDDYDEAKEQVNGAKDFLTQLGMTKEDIQEIVDEVS